MYYELKVGADTVRKKCNGNFYIPKVSFIGNGIQDWTTNASAYPYITLDCTDYNSLSLVASFISNTGNFTITGFINGEGTILTTKNVINYATVKHAISNIDITKYTSVKLSFSVANIANFRYVELLDISMS